MPTVHDPFQVPRRGGRPRGPGADWSVPLFRLGGVSFSLSYSVLFAAAGLAAIVATAAGTAGNDDLTRAALAGASIWATGWLLQTGIVAAVALLIGIRVASVTVGLIGIESRPGSVSPGRSLSLSISVPITLMLVGVGVWLVGFGATLALPTAVAARPWQPPSLGLSGADSIWHASAWLICVQALCQLFPLPRTFGRAALLSTVSIAFRHLAPAKQSEVARRCLRSVALATAVVAFALVPADSHLAVPRWPLFLVLAVALWFSSRSAEVVETMGLLGLARDEAGEADRRPGVLPRLRHWAQGRREQRRLKKIAERERLEAIDAARLDEILDRLHRGGQSSLTDEERAVLQRVSQRLRRVRADHPSDDSHR